MRRLIATAVLVACGTSAAAAGEPPRFNAMCGEVACRVERVPAKWQLLSVDLDLPILKIAYESGGCRRGNPRPSVVETASRVRIEVDQEEVVAMDTPDGVPVCTADLRYGRFNVLLKRPVAGRPIVGGPRISGNALVYDRVKVVDGRVIPLVPRVADLAARDAV